jgi:hypothetical protein
MLIIVPLPFLSFSGTAFLIYGGGFGASKPTLVVSTFDPATSNGSFAGMQQTALQLSQELIALQNFDRTASQMGHFRPSQPVLPPGPLPLRPESGPLRLGCTTS